MHERYPSSLTSLPADSFVLRAISTKAPVHIADIKQHELSDWQRDIASAVGYRSVVAVPMLRDRNPLGVIAVTGQEPNMFSDRQIAMLETFADQAVIAIENTRLFNELECRNRDLTEALEQRTATSEILRVISQSQRDVQPVFEAIATNARKLCEATFGGVYIFDGELLHVATLDGVSPEGIEAINRVFPSSPSRGTSTGRAFLSRTIVYIPDTTKDTEYQAKSAAQARRFSQPGFRPNASTGQPDRSDQRLRQRTRHVLRPPDRHAANLRRSSGDSDREHTAI